MSLPPINPSKAQLKNNPTAANHFGDIHRASRNEEGKHDQDENMFNNQNFMLKIEELKIGESFEDSSRDASPNRYADDTENERNVKIKFQHAITDLKPPRLSIYHTSAPIIENKPEFVTPPHPKKVNNNPYVSSHEISQSDSNSKNQDDDIQFVTDVYGIKYLEMILRDKSLAKSSQINSKKIQTEINLMRMPIEVAECDLNSHLLKLILNDKDDELIAELDSLKLMK